MCVCVSAAVCPESVQCVEVVGRVLARSVFVAGPRLCKKSKNVMFHIRESEKKRTKELLETCR